MKKIALAVLLYLSAAGLALGQDSSFPGLKKAMDPESYARAGLSNLSAEQRAALDTFLKNYVSKKQQDAAQVASTRAVDQAVKERRVQPPKLIESRIVGDFIGTGPRVFYHLANGQVWRPTDGDVQPHSTIPSPSVVLFRDTFGYKMFVEGAGIVRVKRVD
jgi:hypothetical protein